MTSWIFFLKVNEMKPIDEEEVAKSLNEFYHCLQVYKREP